LCAKVQ